MKIELTNQQEQAVKQGTPVEVVDPSTNRAYLVIARETFDNLRATIAPEQTPGADERYTPGGVQRSLYAFLRDLPELLKNQKHDRWFALYHGATRIRIARKYGDLLRECRQRRISTDEYYIGIIRHHEPEPEEIEHMPTEYDDGCEPGSALDSFPVLMPKIIDRLPYFTEPTYEDVGGETVQVKPYQIIVWVSLTAADLLDWEPRIPRFPAILDPGNNHNFSIQEVHLLRWAHLAAKELQPLRSITERRRQLRCYAANVWLYPNIPGTRAVPEGSRPTRLVLAEGIPVFPPATGSEVPYPRLPLLGLRALTDNRLDTTIQGGRRLVSVRTPGR